MNFCTDRLDVTEHQGVFPLFGLKADLPVISEDPQSRLNLATDAMSVQSVFSPTSDG